MGTILLFVGGYNGVNDALAQLLLAPGIEMCRVETRSLAQAVLDALPVEAVIFAFDVPVADALAIAEQLEPRPQKPRLFAILARGNADRERLSRAAVACLESWADGGLLRGRVLESLGPEPAERSPW